MYVRVPRQAWEQLVWRFGNLTAVAGKPEAILAFHVERMRELMSMTDEEILELFWNTPVPCEERGDASVRVILPKAVVEEAYKANVQVGFAVKRALLVFIAKDLPPMWPLTRPNVEKTRVKARVPRIVAKKLSEIGGPSRAWWFCARVLIACAKKAREVRMHVS